MPASVPVVLLHAFGSSRREWSAVSARFPLDRRVLALDLPGFGDAARLGAMDVAAMAEHVDRTIVDAGYARCIVVGHSMAGKIATVLAARKPAYLHGLMLVTPSPPSPEPMDDETRACLLAFDGSREAAARHVDSTTASRLPDDARDLAIADAMRASPAAWKAWVTGGSQEDWSAAVGVVETPTRVIAGADDPALGADVQRRQVMPHFAHARLAVIRGGHALPLENPDELRREIEGFIAQVE